MSFLAALRVEANKKTGRPDCLVASLLASSPDAADIRAALDSGVPGSTIVRALQATGVVMSETTLRKHRRGDCRCVQDAA